MSPALVRFVSVSLLFLAFAGCIEAQTDPDPQLGMRPYDGFDAGKIDQISTTTGGLAVDIPLISYPQRGGNLKLDFALHYQNSGAFANYQCFLGHCSYVWYPRGSGFKIIDVESMGIAGTTGSDNNVPWTVSQIVDGRGSSHIVASVGSTQESLDATQLQLNSTGIITPDGVLITPNKTCNTSQTPYAIQYGIGCEAPLREDTNGNEITFSSSTGWTDTLGRSIPNPATTSTSACPTGPLQVTSATLWNLPGLAGGTYGITFCYVTVPTTIGFGQGAFTVNSTQLQTVILPNSTTWSFQYDSFGNLSQITFPTGGTLAYTWGNFTCGSTGRVVNPVVGTRTLNSVYGYPGANTWTYNLASCNQTIPSTSSLIVTDPLGNDTVHNATSLGTTILSANFYENQTLYYQGSHTTGTLLETVNTTYSSVQAQLANTFPSEVFEVLPTQVTTVWPNGLQSQVIYSYDTGHTFTCPDPRFAGGAFTYGKVTSQSEYDYGSGSAGSLLRRTNRAYMAFSGPNSSSYLANNLLSLPYTVQVLDGGGTQRAYTTYAYDGSSLVSSGITTQHSSTSPAGTYRGNPTSILEWLNTTGGYLTTSHTYFDTGMLDIATDPRSNSTTYTYSSTYVGGYPTTVTNALNQSISRTFDFNTGLVTSTTDANNQVTSFQYDSMLRRLQITHPDLGQTTACYTDEGGTTCSKSTPPFEVVATALGSPSPNIIKTTVYDGLGRLIQTQLSDPDCATGDITATTYDGLGRVASVSNPYCTTSDPTYGVTTTSYDPLGRVTKVVAQDNSSATMSYSGNCVMVTDPAGKARKSCSDGIGRLTQVFEDPNSLNFETDYVHDALNNLLCVAQKGINTGTFGGCGSIPASWRPRNFTFDSLSRLLTASNPESGTISYAYDADGNVITKTAPAPNQTGSATVTTCFGTWSGSSCDGLGYDALNRLTRKSYSDGTTPTAFFTYDQASNWGTTLTNPIGRLTEAWTGTSCCATGGAAIFSYDAMGRVVINNQFTPAISYRPISYTYDLAGNMTTFTDGVYDTFTQTFDAAGRVTQITSNWVDSQHPATLATVDPNVGYWPTGTLRKVALGNGLTDTAAYNNRLQPCRYNVNSSGSALAACSDAIPSGNLQDFNYSFGSSGTNNGNIASMVATGTQAFNRSYAYDSLNRLSALSSPSDPAGCTGLSWTYDPWGNQTDQTVTSGNCLSLHVTVGTNNRINVAPYQYDAAGNMIQDASHQYFYDAENHLIQVDGAAGYCSSGSGTAATACYAYDALGRRVHKATASAQTDYIYNLDSQVISEANSSTWLNVYLHLNGTLFAQYTLGAPRTDFIHTDHLGSARLVTAFVPGTPPTYSVYDSMDYLPFGEQIAGSSATTHKFTSKERDSESGLDNFGARYNSSSLGRFMSPDPGNAGVVNADPQSWNAYAYVRNNPVNLTDPTGAVFCRAATEVEQNQGVTQVCDVTDAEYVNSSKEQQAAYDKAGYTHSDCSCDTNADKAAWAERRGNVSNDYVGDALVVVASFFGLEGLFYPQLHPDSGGRLPQDVDRQNDYPEPPAANNGNGTIGTNPNQRAALTRDIEQARQEGATDIRVNQEQTDAQGVRVGQNRPDLQYTDRNGIRHYIEYDQDPASGAAHAQRIQANDPAGVVQTKRVK